MPIPNEIDVRRVMSDTGMEYMQAYRHMQQRIMLQERNKK